MVSFSRIPRLISKALGDSLLRASKPSGRFVWDLHVQGFDSADASHRHIHGSEGTFLKFAPFQMIFTKGRPMNVHKIHAHTSLLGRRVKVMLLREKTSRALRGRWPQLSSHPIPTWPSRHGSTENPGR